jgi:hypothetical protein
LQILYTSLKGNGWLVAYRHCIGVWTSNFYPGDICRGCNGSAVFWVAVTLGYRYT